MTYSTAAVADVTAFRDRGYAPGEFRRAVFGTFFIGVGSIGAMVGCVTLAAACIVAALHSANSHSHLAIKRPFALGAHALSRLEFAAVERTHHDIAVAERLAAAARALVPQAPAHTVNVENVVKLLVFRAPASQVVAAPQVASLTSSDRASPTPLPAPRPFAARQTAHEFAHASVASAAPEITSSVPAQSGSSSGAGGFLQRLFAPHASRSESPLLAAVDSHTAVYDIEAHVVYLPNGERMEAHSGLGQWIDDPGHVNMKARGATPPNVYNLVMREGLFHGVEALRLQPVGDNSMYGRDGILAHPYMLGPSGQSFGCVSFKDYQAFLQAFKRGEVNRMVVVPHLDGSLPATIRASRDSGNRYAFN